MILSDSLLLQAVLDEAPRKVLEPWDCSKDFAFVPPRVHYAPVFQGDSVGHSVGGAVTYATLRDAILAKCAAMAALEAGDQE